MCKHGQLLQLYVICGLVWSCQTLRRLPWEWLRRWFHEWSIPCTHTSIFITAAKQKILFSNAMRSLWSNFYHFLHLLEWRKLYECMILLSRLNNTVKHHEKMKLKVATCSNLHSLSIWRHALSMLVLRRSIRLSSVTRYWTSPEKWRDRSSYCYCTWCESNQACHLQVWYL